MSVLFGHACKDLGIDYSKKDPKVIKSVEKPIQRESDSYVVFF